MEPKWGAPSSYQATNDYMARMNSTPAIREYFNNPEIGRVAAGLNRRDIEWGPRMVTLPSGERAPIGGPAKDIHNLRMVAAADDIPVIPVTTATLQSFCTDFHFARIFGR